MNKSFLIDSNIIIYSIDNSCSFYYLANLVIEKSIAELYVSIQNIAETFRVVTDSRKIANPLQPVDAKRIILQKVKHLKLIYPNDSTIHSALDLTVSKGIVGLDFYDCILASLIFEKNIDGIITQNIKDFKQYNFLVLDLQDALNYT